METIINNKATIEDSQLPSIIIGKLLNIGGILQREGDKLFLSFGMNQQQFSIFFEITKVGKVKQKEMVNRLLLEKAHVSKVVKKLQKMELISIIPSDDKRSAWLSPTRKGEQILAKCMKALEKWNNEWFEDIDQQERISILDSLSVLQTVFKSKIQKNKQTNDNY